MKYAIKNKKYATKRPNYSIRLGVLIADLCTWISTKSMNKFSTGEILKTVCKELNLTNKQVADILSTSHQNVSRIFTSDNVNTDTINRLTEGLGINIYHYLAKKWEQIANEDPGIEFKEPRGEYFVTTPRIQPQDSSKPKISILIEIDRDKQDEIMKLLKL